VDATRGTGQAEASAECVPRHLTRVRRQHSSNRTCAVAPSHSSCIFVRAPILSRVSVDVVADGIRSVHHLTQGRPLVARQVRDLSADTGVTASQSHRFRTLASDPKPLTAAQKQAVIDAFATDPKALNMRNQSPRFGPSDPAIESAYYIGMGIHLASGFAIGFLNLFFTGLYMFCRCCCWRCMCKKKSDWEVDGFQGYLTFWDKVSQAQPQRRHRVSMAVTRRLRRYHQNLRQTDMNARRTPTHDRGRSLICALDCLAPWSLCSIGRRSSSPSSSPSRVHSRSSVSRIITI
jgi:hypothetical protein